MQALALFLCPMHYPEYQNTHVPSMLHWTGAGDDSEESNMTK